MKTLNEWQLELDLPPSLELLHVSFGDNDYYLASSFTSGDLPVTWNGNSYSPFPFVLNNIGYSDSNGVDKSTLTISAINNEFVSILPLIPDLTGALVSWVLIFDEYLNTSSFVSNHKLKITKMQAKSKKGIVYECGSIIDERITLPRRLMLREGTVNGRFAGLGLNRA